MEKIYNKLVRDKIPEIIRKNNEIPIIKQLNDIEYKSELERKLLEEYNEVLNAKLFRRTCRYARNNRNISRNTK